MAFNWVKFPWTNLHDLNLDWIIQTVKTLENNLADAVGQFTEIVNTAVGAEREERIAKDAEIQAEITTEVYPTISKSITDTLTGSGDLTIDKAGTVNISGNGVKIEDKRTGGRAQIIGGAFVSDASNQLTLNNPNSSTNMTANYNSGVLSLSNNQEFAKGVAVSPINTPADGGRDNSTFAANVGYVKTAVEAVRNALSTETENRTSGDAALQSTIDSVIMPLLNAVQKRAPHVFYFSTTAEAGTLTAQQVETIRTAVIDHTPIIFVADNELAAHQCFYYVVNYFPIPTAENINEGGLNVELRTLDGRYNAMFTFAGAGSPGIVTFDTLSGYLTLETLPTYEGVTE